VADGGLRTSRPQFLSLKTHAAHVEDSRKWRKLSKLSAEVGKSARTLRFSDHSRGPWPHKEKRLAERGNLSKAAASSKGVVNAVKDKWKNFDHGTESKAR